MFVHELTLGLSIASLYTNAQRVQIATGLKDSTRSLCREQQQIWAIKVTLRTTETCLFSSVVERHTLELNSAYQHIVQLKNSSREPSSLTSKSAYAGVLGLKSFAFLNCVFMTRKALFLTNFASALPSAMCTSVCYSSFWCYGTVLLWL